MMIRWKLVEKYMIWLILLVTPFLVLQFGHVECCLEEERLALLELKAYMNSYNSNPNNSTIPWSNPREINCCKWSEVRCNVSSGRVTKLILGQLVARDDEDAMKKPWLFNVSLFRPFSQLISLDLSYNDINGLVEDDGSTKISTLKNLRVLELNGNNLGSGHISVSDLTSLRKLRLTSANLNESSFPLYQGTWLCRLRNLQELYLFYNMFKGSIPPCINNFTSLQSLVLSYNNFEGKFSMHSLANHSKLLYLGLSRNKLQVQTEDALWTPTFQLQFLDLRDCRLNEPHGTIPKFLSYQYNLNGIALSGNNLVGSFPTWLLTNNSHLQDLFLFNNFLTGNLQLPHHTKPLYEMTQLSISNNSFCGELPKTIGLVLPNIKTLNLAENSFEGQIPSSISQMSNLQGLDMSHNNFSGELPSRLLSNLSSLVTLRLSNNNLQGEVIPDHMNLPSLSWLKLSNNNFGGKIKDALIKSRNLQAFDISNNKVSGRLPYWINSKFRNLKVLQLGGNRLQGQLPLQLCELAHINILDISHNNLSGVVPACFKNMSFGRRSIDSFYTEYTNPEEVNVLVKNDYLTYAGPKQVLTMSVLDLSCNKLTGLIPPELGELEQLHSLNFSHNYLSGPIPSSFSNLKQIEGLDLSFNNLSSNIPSQLVELNFLAVFNVSYNNLSGRVPATGQFGDFDESSYLGNPGLFGFPGSDLHNQTRVMPPSSLTKDGGDGDHHETFVEDFLWSFGMSCATIFLATIAVLHINPRWRQACFDFVDWYILWWLPMSWRSLY
uniref:Leucine-rich repeat-containing N-terminal plant-type domain-containing protein n=1 Tax=Chenopodium quinoa TaxID=63459 RepID=A0A803LE91_CHEQI